VPIYEYQCKNCGHVFEREHPIGQNKHYKCPECSSGKVIKLVSQVGVVFKGSGFYITDSRREAKFYPKKGEKKESTESVSCDSCKLSEN